jgi:hypothetical protein
MCVCLCACGPLARETPVGATGPGECARIEITRGDGHLESAEHDRSEQRRCVLIGPEQSALLVQEPGGSDVKVDVRRGAFGPPCSLEACP